MAAGKKQYFFVSSLEKGFKIIELLAEHQELSVTALAGMMGTDTSSSHRFLSTLKELGYVEKNAEKRYQLTWKLLEQGMKVADRFEIRRIAYPFMQKLSKRFGQNINLAYFNGHCVIHLEQIPSKEMFRTDPGIGTKLPAYATALGKVILAFLPEEELESYLESVEFLPMGPKTILTKQQLRKELKKVVENGYAVDDEELALGLKCVAAPIPYGIHKTMYSMSIAGPTFYLTPEIVLEMAEEIKSTCLELSRMAGKT